MNLQILFVLSKDWRGHQNGFTDIIGVEQRLARSSKWIYRYYWCWTKIGEVIKMDLQIFLVLNKDWRGHQNGFTDIIGVEQRLARSSKWTYRYYWCWTKIGKVIKMDLQILLVLNKDWRGHQNGFTDIIGVEQRLARSSKWIYRYYWCWAKIGKVIHWGETRLYMGPLP